MFSVEAESCYITQASLNIMAALLNGGIAGVCHQAWLSLAFQRIKQRTQCFRGLAEWTTLVKCKQLAGADLIGLTVTIEEQLNVVAVPNLSLQDTQGSLRDRAEPDRCGKLELLVLLNAYLAKLCSVWSQRWL